MTLDENSDEDMAITLAFKEIRRLRDDLRKERLTKHEVLGRYEKVVFEKQSLETRVALAEAELKQLKHVKPKLVGSHESSFLGIP